MLLRQLVVVTRPLCRQAAPRSLCVRTWCTSTTQAAVEPSKTEWRELKDWHHPWLTHVKGTVNMGDVTVGTTMAQLIDREMIRDGFRESLSKPSQGLADIAETVFDETGCLQKRWHGTFGTEVDTGSMLHIDVISVRRDYRQHGVGPRMVIELLEYIGKRANIAVVLPVPLIQAAATPEETRKLEEKVAKLYRNGGFRRVGRSRYMMCVINDKSHPSWRVEEPDPNYDEPITGHGDLAGEGDRMLQEAAIQGGKEDILKAVEAGGDVNGPALALHFAAANGNIKAVQALLELGANINACDPDGNTPLHCVAGGPEDNSDIIRLLIEKGADVKPRNSEGLTAVDLMREAILADREFIRAFGLRGDQTSESFLQSRAEAFELLRKAAMK